MTTTNYDQSSTGINLELNCFYDSDRARSDFEESFHVLQNSSYRQNSILVFSQFGNFDVEDFHFEDIGNYSFTKKDLLNLLKSKYHVNDVNNDCKRYFDKPLSRMTKDELIEYFDGYTDSYENAEHFQELLSPNFIKMTSRGYCQGDYSEIIVPKIVVDDYLKNSGTLKTNEDIEQHLQAIIDNLLWDQPVYARLDIDGEDYYFDEHLKDIYRWDRDQVLEGFKANFEHDQKEYIIEWLEENLPSELEYC